MSYATTCCVLGCSSNNSNVQLHSLPLTEERLKIWLNQINNPNILNEFKVSQLRNVKVCLKHFEKRFILPRGTKLRRRLKVNAYPTLFTPDEIKSGFPNQPTHIIGNTTRPVFNDHNYCTSNGSDHTYATLHMPTDPPGEGQEMITKLCKIPERQYNCPILPDSLGEHQLSDTITQSCQSPEAQYTFPVLSDLPGEHQLQETIIELSESPEGHYTFPVLPGPPGDHQLQDTITMICESPEDMPGDHQLQEMIFMLSENPEGQYTCPVLPGAESPTSCARTVEQDELDEGISDEDGCNPAVSTWIKKLQSVGTTRDTTEAPIKSSDDNVRTEESTLCENTNKQHEHHAPDELPTYPALTKEGFLEAEEQESPEQIDECTTNTWGEEEIEFAKKEELSARCCACLSDSSQLTPLESIEIVVRPGLTQHLDALYTDLTGLEVPACIGRAAICVECVSRLTAAYTFKLQCVESLALLTSSALLPPPTRDHQQSAPGSPAGCPPSPDESATHMDEALEEAECLTLPVASASPYVDEPSGTVNKLSNADRPSTETKVTSSLISIKDNKRKNAEQLNTGSSKKSHKILKYKENEIKLRKCQSCEKAAAADAKTELAIQLTMQSVCCICTKSFRDSAAHREHARTSHSANFQDFLSTATNISRMCTCNYNIKLLKNM